MSMNRQESSMAATVDFPLQVSVDKRPKVVFQAVSYDNTAVITTLNGTTLDAHMSHQFFDPIRFQSFINGAMLHTPTVLSADDNVAPGGSVQLCPARKGGGWLDNVPDSHLMDTTLKCLRIDDTPSLGSFYENRFAFCRQTACKLIAKAWVKAIEPRKQSNHPYTGHDEAAPEWWPLGQHVPHKEPDHLLKPARLRLLVHMLRLTMSPTSHIRLSGLNVTRLEDLAQKALSSHFSIRRNAPRRRFLVELFEVAKKEERYLNGEIDGTTQVQVMADERISERTGSNNGDSTTMSMGEDRSVPRSMVEGFNGTSVSSTPPGQDNYSSCISDKTSPFNPSIAADMHHRRNDSQSGHANHPSGEPPGEASTGYNHLQGANFYNELW